jgi:hypothetical protein
MFIAKNNDLIILAKDTRQELENALGRMYYTFIEETEIDYQLYNDEYLTPEEIAQKEKERIGNLQVTKRVFALALQQLGISYSQLKTLIATSEQAQLEWDLCVELQRKNPLLDVMAAQMGITSAQLDYIFRKANGEDIE